MKKNKLFWLISFAFIAFMLWAVYDMMSQTTPPWERKKQRLQKEQMLKEKNTAPKIKIKKDSVGK